MTCFYLNSTKLIETVTNLPQEKLPIAEISKFFHIF